MADDLAQDTFVRAIAALGGFRADASARTWLLSIARRACADHVRRQVRGRNLLDRLTRQTVLDELAPDATGEVDLDHLIRMLGGERREAFVLTQVLGLSYANAADVCRCPVGTVGSRVSRARADLVAALEQPGRADTG